MLRNAILTVSLLLCAWIVTAQEVKLKKGKVLIDGVESFDYTVDMLLAETHVYKLGSRDEIVLITFNNNGTREYKGDDYMTVYFTPTNTKLTTGALYYGLRGEIMVKKLITEGVIHGDGSINPQRLETFIGKYAEN